jgi:hypothetical protein
MKVNEMSFDVFEVRGGEFECELIDVNLWTRFNGF